MGKIPKYKLDEINRISLYDDVLRKHGHDFTDHGPDTWDREQTRLFDMMVELEVRIKERLLQIVEKNNRNLRKQAKMYRTIQISKSSADDTIFNQASKSVDDAYYDAASPHYKDNERYRHAVETIYKTNKKYK